MAESKNERQDKIERRIVEQTGGASAVIVGFKSDRHEHSPASIYRQETEKLFAKKDALGAGIVLKLKVRERGEPYFCICNNFRGISLGPNGSRFEPQKAEVKSFIRKPSETAISEAHEEFFSLLSLTSKELAHVRVMEITVSKNKTPEYHRTVYEVERAFGSDEEMQAFLAKLNFAAKHINPLYIEAQTILKQNNMNAVEEFVADITSRMKTLFLPGPDPKVSLYKADPTLRDSLEKFVDEVKKVGPLPLEGKVITRVLTDTFGRSTQFSSFDVIPTSRMQLMTKLALALVKSADAAEMSEDGVTVQVTRGDKGKVEGFTATDNGKTYKFSKFMLFDTLGCFKSLLVTCNQASEITPKKVDARPLPPASSVASSLSGALNPKQQQQPEVPAAVVVKDGEDVSVIQAPMSP